MASPSKKPADEPGGSWTADRLARLETLSRAGETAQAIAQQLGVSRSAVIGKLFRLGRVFGKQRFRLKRSKKRSKIRNEKRGKSLLELTDKSCRWPIGDPSSEQFHFCGAAGADLELGVPYCALHMQRAYGAPISPGISATVRRMFRDAMARRERT